MSQRLADIGRRIATVRQLGAVVNAMRGVAAARAQQSRARLPAMRAYAQTAARAIGDVGRLQAASPGPRSAPRGHRGLIVFGAEQGFAGAFPEQILAAAAHEFEAMHVFLIGSRTVSLAAERGLKAAWQGSLPHGVAALAETASDVVEAVYDYLAEVGPAPIRMQYASWEPGHGARIVRRSLLPLDETLFVSTNSRPPPITNLPTAELLGRLAQEYVFAQLYEAAAETFAAENEARAATMAAARTHIDERLATLQADERRTRQEEITAEVVELAAGMRFRGR